MRARRYLTLGPVLALLATTVLASPVPAAQATDVDAVSADEPAVDVAQKPPGRVQTIELTAPPGPGPFSMNLYTKGDFVHQQTRYWCVAASVQTMINIIEDGEPDRSKAFQRQLHFQARDLDDAWDRFRRKVAGKARWEGGLHGLDLRDWEGTLDANGYGPYDVERARTRRQAIRMAARAIRPTGRPAGLLVWRGAHAWVMSGFAATADPAYTNDFKVERVFIQDPWYPRVSAIWGTSRPPNSAVSMAALDEDFLRYDDPDRRNPMRDGKYMLILPTLPTGTEVPTEPPGARRLSSPA